MARLGSLSSIDVTEQPLNDLGRLGGPIEDCSDPDGKRMLAEVHETIKEFDEDMDEVRQFLEDGQAESDGIIM